MFLFLFLQTLVAVKLQKTYIWMKFKGQISVHPENWGSEDV